MGHAAQRVRRVERRSPNVKEKMVRVCYPRKNITIVNVMEPDGMDVPGVMRGCQTELGQL
jgi:hypothetical protein